MSLVVNLSFHEIPRVSCINGFSVNVCKRRKSERGDLNPRPPEPHSGALPGCATLRNLIHRFQLFQYMCQNIFYFHQRGFHVRRQYG